jgi:SP family myo-inositol transporter-like MFS transporter 13
MKLSHQSGLPRVVGSVQNYPGQPGVPLHSQSKHKEANAAAEDDDEQLEEVEVEPVMDRGLEAVENRKGEVLISSDGGYGDEGMHPPLAGGVTHELGSSTWAMLLLTAVAAIGGFLFGYGKGLFAGQGRNFVRPFTNICMYSDSGVVSGAMLKIKSDLHLVPWQEEVVVSSTVGAAILGSLGGGYLNEILGRKPIIILAALTFTLGALEMALSWNFASLTVGRIIVGLAIGLASLTTPVYIAESAPAHLRGRLVSINIVLISLGQFSAGMIDGVFAEVPGGWRWMLGLSGVPSVLMLFGMIPLPESPRWLMGKGLREESCQVLQVLRGVRADISQEVEEMQEGIRQAGDKHASLWLLLSTPHLRRALFIGCGLQLVQQLVGINTVMYYSGEIYS